MPADADAPPDLPRDFFRRPEQMRAAGYVGKGLVDGDALDQRRESVEDADGGVTKPLILLEMPSDKDEVRA